MAGGSGRAFAAVVSVALIALTMSPVTRGNPRSGKTDGYPLSTYPMFAWKRPTVMTMSYPIGETANGTRRYLTPRIIGSGEVLQARAIVERAVGKGGQEVVALCTKVAKSVARVPEYKDVVRIRVMTGTHDSIEFLSDNKLGKEQERTRCEVKR